MRQRTIERITVLAFVFIGIQTATALLETKATGVVLYGGLCCLSLGTLGLGLAGFDIGVNKLPGRRPRSRVGGISTVIFGLGWLAVPAANAISESLGLYDALGIAAGVFFIWSGAQMYRGHDQYRFAEPGEDLLAKNAEKGRNAGLWPVLRDEAFRSIGAFGLLYIPTLLFVGFSPSANSTDLWVYVPAAFGTLVSALLITQLRLRTGAGPQLGQIRRAAREDGWMPFGR